MLFLYLLINLVAFLLMYIDKESAKSGGWRIPEKTLFLAAALGGGVGGTIGMFRLRHKTKHWYFQYAFPPLAGVQILLVLYSLFS